MTLALISLLTTLPTSPTLTVSNASELSLDGQPWNEAVECKRLAGQTVVVRLEPKASWAALSPVVQQARRCPFNLSIPSNEQPAWRLLDQPTTPLFVVRASPRSPLLFDGAVAELALDSAAELALVERTFPLGTPLCLYVAPGTSAARVQEGASKLTASGRRGLCLVLEEDRPRLPPAEQLLLARLLGEQLPDTAPSPQAGGLLTQALGRSSTVTPVERQLPRWTRASSLVCLADGKTVLRGIGNVSGLRNQALARTTADNRARAELAKLFEVTLTRGQGSVSSFSAVTLSGVQILDHFVEEKTTWALASLDAPAGVTATAACPEGVELVRSWEWRGVAADGGFGTPRPAWAKDGLRQEEERLSLTVTLETAGPVQETHAAATELVRLRLAEALLGVALAPPIARDAHGVACLWAVPWRAAADEAEVQIWQDPDKGQLVVQASLSLSELRAALPYGCAAGEVDTLAKRATDRPPPASPKVDYANIEYPEWVRKGTGARNDEGGRVFYGVGSVSGIRNHALARTTADNRARAEIAKLIEVYTAVSMKDYMAERAETSAAHVEQAIRTFSAVTLSGVQIVDHWFHPDGTIYALAQLDLAEWAERATGVRGIDAPLREWVRKNAERMHEQVAREKRR